MIPSMYSKLLPGAGNVLLILSIVTSTVGAYGQEPSETRAVTIPNSHVIDMPTAKNGVSYQLYVHVPPACSESAARCPAVYMLDAEYSFGLAAQIVTHLSDRDRIRPTISVAIAYSDKSAYRSSRSRDYTPYFYATGGYGVETQRNSGGGPAFLSFIESKVIPLVESRFGAVPENRTLVGHSYGGLFAVHTWLNSAGLFDNYIIVSPSLWYADRQVFEDLEKVCSARGRSDGRQHMFLAVGEYEEQPDTGRAMVSDLEEFNTELMNCRGRRVTTTLRVYADETHASIFPAALSTGLRNIYQ